MPLDPQARAYLDQLAALGGPPTRSLTPEQMRAITLERRRRFGGPPPAVARIEDHTVPGPAGGVPIQVYVPDAPGPLPVLVFCHGGGWVRGCVETHEGVCRALANLTPCIVASVEYRLAPEAKFPAPLEDCYA